MIFFFIGEEEGEGGNGLDSARCGNLSAWLGCLLVRNFQLKQRKRYRSNLNDTIKRLLSAITSSRQNNCENLKLFLPKKML